MRDERRGGPEMLGGRLLGPKNHRAVPLVPAGREGPAAHLFLVLAGRLPAAGRARVARGGAGPKPRGAFEMRSWPPRRSFGDIRGRSDCRRCQAPFEPEGVVASLLAPLTVAVGAHYGALAKAGGDVKRAWAVSATACLVLGGICVWPLGIQPNKQLWSFSYAFLTAGMCGVALVAAHVISDSGRPRLAAIFVPFQVVGKNALFVFVMAACDVFNTMVDAVYVHRPGNDFVGWVHHSVFRPYVPGGNRWCDDANAQLAFVLAKVSFWICVSWGLDKVGWYWKF